MEKVKSSVTYRTILVSEVGTALAAFGDIMSMYSAYKTASILVAIPRTLCSKKMFPYGRLGVRAETVASLYARLVLSPYVEVSSVKA